MTLEILTLLMIVTGTVIIGITYFNIKKENKKNVSHQMNINEAGFEEYHIELNETALDIYKELDNKYQEILVIYELIEKKYGEIKNSTKKNFSSDFNKSVSGASYLDNTYNNKVNEESLEQIFAQNSLNSELNNKSRKKPELSVFKQSSNGKDRNVNIVDDNLAVRLLDEQLKEEKVNNKQNRHSDVIELLNKGLGVEQIARELNIGTGEVLFVKELLKVKNEHK